MKNFKYLALCAFKFILALSAMFLPLKPVNTFAEDSAPPGSSDSSPPDSTTSFASPDSTALLSDPIRNVPTCEDGYEYVESVGKCYKKCQDGWERNPETNRCRKIRTEASSENISAETSSASNSPPGSSVAPSPGSTSFPLPTTPKLDTTISGIPTCKDGYEYVESVDKCYKKCQDGWERNLETNRCRKIPTESEYETEPASSIKSSNFSDPPSKTAETLDATSCKEGYEYVESAGKCYKKCQDGQIRNPETNRCKKAASESSGSSEASKTEISCKDGYEYVESANKCYKKCQDGYERSPETNRCRKAKDNSGADYAVDVPETGGSPSFAAGGAIIALLVAGIIFITFQYHLEIKEFVKKHFKKSEKSS